MQVTADRISKKQIARLCAIASQEGGFTDMGRDRLVAEYGYESKTEITRDDYEEICERLASEEEAFRFNRDPNTNDMFEGDMENEEQKAGLRPLREIEKDLKQPIPNRLLETKTLKGNKITYCPWYRVQKILDHYTGGLWEYEVRDKTITTKHLMMTVRIYIHAEEGTFFRDGTGVEKLSVDSFGDPQSNAESMAFRRAAARWGVGLALYEGGDD